MRLHQLIILLVLVAGCVGLRKLQAAIPVDVLSESARYPAKVQYLHCDADSSPVQGYSCFTGEMCCHEESDG